MWPIEDLAAQAGCCVVATAKLPGREARFSPIPEDLHPRLRQNLQVTWPGGLYSHQTAALQAFLKGNDVCLTTATASGKSQVFMAATAHALLMNDRACAVALYPARALIQDQLRKWEAQLQPLGIPFGHIDGGVPTVARCDILRTKRVVLMTPDVAHSWLLAHVADPEIKTFLSSLQILVLDEAHVYEGVFGTNMAYFLRRLQVASSIRQIICSTATLGKPANFLQQLTGRDPITLGLEADSAASPQKDIAVLRCLDSKPFDAMVALLASLADANHGRFLAFADSRRLVEQLVAALHRSARPPTDSDTDPEERDLEDSEDASAASAKVLPYRAGLEGLDRKLIEDALHGGQLAGVAATSALELGIDIGDLDIIVMLGPPPSVKAFRQRLGRAGRRKPALCIVLDDKGVFADSTEALQAYLTREPEPNWLYLENRYLQYTNALCAAQEIGQNRADSDLAPFRSLPSTFITLLENEIDPKEVLPDDFYALKQDAQGDPHHEFPIRSGVEKEFRVQTRDMQPLGTLTLSQALREAYPGAIYLYMGRAYRVSRFDFRKGQITVKRTKQWSTRPVGQTTVFPRFQGGTLALLRSDLSFVAESEMQVSERVIGFTERRGGAARQTFEYGPSSTYYRSPLTRFFQTTGVCWYFPDRDLLTEPMAQAILEAFCLKYSIQERDLGLGTFHARETPLGQVRLQGFCIYDAATGSLRLTQQLAAGFPAVVELALTMTSFESNKSLLKQLGKLKEALRDLQPATISAAGSMGRQTEGDWIEVVAPLSRAMCFTGSGATELEVLAYRYTPQGLLYEVTSSTPGAKQLVNAKLVQPINGLTITLLYNLMTGETKPATPS